MLYSSTGFQAEADPSLVSWVSCLNLPVVIFPSLAPATLQSVCSPHASVRNSHLSLQLGLGESNQRNQGTEGFDPNQGTEGFGTEGFGSNPSVPCAAWDNLLDQIVQLCSSNLCFLTCSWMRRSLVVNTQIIMTDYTLAGSGRSSSPAYT